MSDVDAEFSGETIELDAKVFGGDEHFVFAECGLERGTFEFVAGAKRTIEQLASMYKFG